MNYYNLSINVTIHLVFQPHPNSPASALLQLLQGTVGKWEKTRAYKVHRIFQNTPSVQAAAFFRAPAASWSEPWLVLLTYGNRHFHHFLHIQDLQDQIHLLAFSTLCQQTSRPSKGAVSPSHFFQQAYLEEPLEKWGRWYVGGPIRIMSAC